MGIKGESMQAWEATKLGTNKQGKICYEISCNPDDEVALRKLMQVFFNLQRE